MVIRIKALDTLFFRDGRPFSMRDDSWATGMFPPSPSVIYGVLRSAYLSEHGYSEQNIQLSSKLKIHQILLEKSSSFGDVHSWIFWLPRDVAYIPKGKSYELKVLQPKLLKDISNFPQPLTHQLCYSSPGEETPEEIDTDEFFVDELSFRSYCEESTVHSLMARSEVITLEPKVGIGRENATRTAAEGQLYRVGMNRLQGENSRLNLIVDFTGIDLPEAGLLKIGGEGKTASYEKVIAPLSMDFPNLNDNYFKIYLATPAIFDQGWLPSWINEGDLTGGFKGLELKLISALVPRPVSIGGYDIKNNRPKTMYRAVPTGAVYYFKLLKGMPEEVKDVFQQRCISDQRRDEGFGLTFVAQTKIQA